MLNLWENLPQIQHKQLLGHIIFKIQKIITLLAAQGLSVNIVNVAMENALTFFKVIAKQIT